MSMYIIWKMRIKWFTLWVGLTVKVCPPVKVTDHCWINTLLSSIVGLCMCNGVGAFRCRPHHKLCQMQPVSDGLGFLLQIFPLICYLISGFSFLFSRMAEVNERTFLAIKPDGVQRGIIGEIIKRFEVKGFKLVGMKMLHVSKLLVCYALTHIYCQGNGIVVSSPVLSSLYAHDLGGTLKTCNELISLLVYS